MTDRWNTPQEDQAHSDSTIRAAEEAMFPEPTKPKRPAYRPLWEQAERELRAVRALYSTEYESRTDAEEQADLLVEKLATARSALAQWKTVATTEAVAIVIITLIQLAR